MTRSLIRENLFKLIFRIEFNGTEDMPEQVRLFFEDSLKHEELANVGSDIPTKDAEYIKGKYESIINNLSEIDSKISSASKGWSIDRIGKVELAVLRLAVYEMLYDDDIPVSVAIDEAIELTKKYGQEASPAFVNGILAALAK